MRLDANSPVLLWDVGGTLVDRVCSPMEATLQAFSIEGLPFDLDDAAFHRLGREYEALELNWRTVADEEQGYRDWVSLLLRRANIPSNPELIERLSRRMGNYFAQFQPIPGIPELLRELEERGIRQAIVSNWQPSLCDFLRYHGLGSCFTCVLCSCEEGLFKPNAALFQRALDRLQIESSQTVYIGNDPIRDMVPARALGMNALHFDPRREHVKADAHTSQELRSLLFKRGI